MTPSLALALAVGVFIAWANGANDVSKGIATLVGSGVTDLHRAIRWGTLWTAAGGLGGMVLGAAMVTTFGKGLLAPGTVPTLAAAVATIAGAALWVLLSTRLGLPVSTTHAIVGALLGVALLAYGIDGVRWSAIGGKVLLPLALSPLVALALTRAGLSLLRRQAPGSPLSVENDCVCVDAVTPIEVGAGAGASAVGELGMLRVRLTTGTVDGCARSRPSSFAITIPKLHWLTSGATSFARGVNDAPKMAALVIAALAVAPRNPVSLPMVFGAVTLGMVGGSWFAGRRVTELLATKVTPLDHAGGFGANLVTAMLVTGGAVLGLPMSTTHVASGAIIGVAGRRGAGTLNANTLRDMVLAWLATLPGAALLGAGAYLVLVVFR